MERETKKEGGLTELGVAEDGLEIELFQRLSVYRRLVRGYMRRDGGRFDGGGGDGAGEGGERREGGDVWSPTEDAH